LATTSSVAANRGNRHSPAYSAARAFRNTYFEGLHLNPLHLGVPLYVTGIQPGFVDTKMAKGPGFRVSSPKKPARQIAHTLDRRRRRVYITRRRWLIAKVFKGLPDWIYRRLG